MASVSTILSVALATSIGALVGVSWPSQSVSTLSAPHSAKFSICYTGGGTNCVVDGDTAWISGVKVRIADIDAPETHPARCALEAELGNRATVRLTQLLNAGELEMVGIGRDRDRYGRKLRVLVRQGRSIGNQLVSEGLARTYDGGRRLWC